MTRAHRESAAPGGSGLGGASKDMQLGDTDVSNCTTADGARQRLNIALRPYQETAVSTLRARLRNGAARPLLYAPTGAGKTIIAAGIIERAVAKSSRVLFIAHRRELIQQAARKLYEAAGIDAGVVMAGYPHRPEQPVQVASIQTLHARAVRGTAMEAPPADLVVLDECHRARSKTYTDILATYPNAYVLGLTATPCRGDGKGLGNVFDDLVQCPDVGQLVQDGYLTPTTVYAPSQPDLEGVRVERGDYVESQLAERMDDAELVGDMVTHWLKLASDRKTVVFASGVNHSVHLRNRFREAGIVAEHIDGTTPTDEREAILARLSEGTVQVLVNALVLTEGWDQPDVSCAVLARPTKSLALYRQMVGRVLRPAPGKSDALILDHAGSTLEHGFVEEPIDWTLDTDRRVESKTQAARRNGERPKLTTCPECGAVRGAGSPCTACGWRPQPKADAPEVAEGELTRLGRDGGHTPQSYNPVWWYRELLWIARERGYKDGWAAHKYREKFGSFPRFSKGTYSPHPGASVDVRRGGGAVFRV